MVGKQRREVRGLFPVPETFLINCHLIGVLSIVAVRGTPHFLLQKFAFMGSFLRSSSKSPHLAMDLVLRCNFQSYSIDGAR